MPPNRHDIVHLERQGGRFPTFRSPVKAPETETTIGGGSIDKPGRSSRRPTDRQHYRLIHLRRPGRQVDLRNGEVGTVLSVAATV
jgi:hypothetical protein